MAITIDTFRILISEGQELLRDIDLYDRQFEFEGSGRYVLTGVRQAGKSYMLFKRARQLMSEGRLPEEFIYIDFDDERLIGMDAGDFDTILQAYRSTEHRGLGAFRPETCQPEVSGIHHRKQR